MKAAMPERPSSRGKGSARPLATILASVLTVAILLACVGDAATAQDTATTPAPPPFPNCNKTENFTCKNGFEIPCSETCNGINDCGDNSDETGCPAAKSDWRGFLAAAVASVFFGSNYIPAKKFETGDGMFFQWVLCAGIWLVGLIVNYTQGQVTFEPVASVGGCLWAIGNMTVIPIISLIGLAQGMLVWGTTNMVIGWASARFGWFGIIPELPDNINLQYVGVAFAGVSVLAFAFVKPNVGNESETESEKEYLIGSSEYSTLQIAHPEPAQKKTRSMFDKLSPMQKRILGVVLSVFGGVNYGLNFCPPQVLMDTHKGASQNGLDYVFSHFSGIFMTSTIAFLVYCALKKNRPTIYPRAILPGFLSGAMWAVAQTCWFIANEHLSQAVAFPIISTCPGVVASLWGLLVFKEITGLKNIMWLLLAFALTFTGIALVVVSKN